MSEAKPLSRRAFLGASAGVAGGAVLAGPLARSAGAAAPAHADLALTHVTVIDVKSGQSQHDMTVLVAGHRIRAVGRSADMGIPAHVKTLDLSGKYLIPGLCDVHVHSSDENIDLPMHIANGVTTVREMWGLPTTHEWRQKIGAGTLLGPRYVIGSPIIDGSPTLWNDSAPRPAAPIVVSTEAQGRQAVRAVKRDGADFVKVYSRLSRAAFNGIADEARRQRIRFGGHVPDVIPVEDAVRAGMWSFEHLDGLWWSTSGRESRLRREIAAIRIDPKDAYESWFEQIGRLEWEAATSYRPEKARRLFSLLRRNNAWQVPTLTMLQRLDTPGDPGDPRMKYVPAETAAYWQIWSDTVTQGRTAEQVAQHRVLFELRQQLVNAMSRAGVPIVAGTDTGTTYLFPGFSLHDELALLVQAGLSSAQALRAATYEPARFLGLAQSQGTVSKGKLADLVVLDADPLADIRNTQRIHAVVLGGQLISSAQRSELLAGAAKAASGSAAAAVARCGCHAHAH